jgi:hypothetical protein
VTRVFTVIFFAGILTSCVHYWSKFTFRGVGNNSAPTATRSLSIDSDQVRIRIHAEELRQAEELRRIRELPPSKPRDPVSAKARLEAYDKLVDLQARAAFLSDLRSIGTVDVPATARGIIVGWSECRCTKSTGSFQQLVKARFKLRSEHRLVEGWICEDVITMMHNWDL